MSTPTTTESIHTLLPRVMSEIGAISKDKKSHQGYSFRGIDDVLNHCNPALIKHSVTVSPRITSSERTVEKVTTNQGKESFRVTTFLTMDVIFTAPDASFITVTTCGEGIDTASDKATNKAMAAAFKYALFFGLCIPLDSQSIEDSDRDAPHEDAPKPKPSLATPEQVAEIDRLAGLLKYDSDKLAAIIQASTKGRTDKPSKMTQPEALVIIKGMTKKHNESKGESK